MVRTITIPNGWTPRQHQLEALQHLDSGFKRAFLVWHRRAGKDSFAINYAAKEAFQKTGTYFHMLPTSKQARKVVWQGINKDTGIRYIDQAFPKELRKRTVEDEMLIELRNGSFWQCLGSDNYDAAVGTNPLGITFSEWSISNPRAWDYMRPILAENNGFAIFIGTPRGKNFFFDQYQLAIKHPRWYCSLRTIDDTGLVSHQTIQDEIDAGMPESRARQEFWCSFDAENIGAIYEKWIVQLEKTGRITSVPYDPRYPVETAHDIGHRDAHAIWFVQRVGVEIRLIDYHEQKGHDLKSLLKVLREKPYVYSRHIFPHDMNKFEFGAGATISEQARQHGLHHVVAPKLSEEEGIEHVRTFLPRMTFDAVKCRRGLQALRSFRYEEDGDEEGEKLVLKTKPKHDWASHGSKALQYYVTTPDSWGHIPQWARQMMPQHGAQPAWMGHNGGPALDAATEDYDPLAAFRGLPQTGQPHFSGQFPPVS